MTIDFHQHLWPEPFIAALARRDGPPRLRGSMLELAGGLRATIDLQAHALESRLALLDRFEIDVAVVSLPPTLGVGALHEEESTALHAAYEEGILELAEAAGGRLVALAAGPNAVGFRGACVGAHELEQVDRIATWLDELERTGRFLLVHPGPARTPPGAPDWWPAVVAHTAQMQAAYAMWLAEGIQRWPGLKVVFSLLAGGAPFQLERLQSRGVTGREILYPNLFFETASYGRRALELCLATFGVDQLLFGSEVPVLDPQLGMDAVRAFGDAVAEALCDKNPAGLVGRI